MKNDTSTWPLSRLSFLTADEVRTAAQADDGPNSLARLEPDRCRPVEQAAPLAERRPLGDPAALAPPRQMPPK